MWITEKDGKKYIKTLLLRLSFPIESGKRDLRNCKRRKTNMTLNKFR